MTSQNPFGGRRAVAVPTVPKGDVVASYDSYLDAQLTVDVLVHADFPVDKVSILGNDLKTVEHITGRLSWGRVALAGAASGAWFGIFIGIVLLLFGGRSDFSLLLAALLLGAGFGMAWGLISYALTRRRRDYTSQTAVLATSYSVVVDPDLANRARNVLAENNRGAGDI